ncbi:MAG: ribosomal protein S18-alanine N-acetyltransferase [Phascolarctobacterium sp.]|nr:ribosomal protein S18-alanine N-acetyltransferase [Candidatus Phascolarctobacterium equi]
MGKTAPLIREFQNYDKIAVAAIEKNCFEDAWTEVMLLQQSEQKGSVYFVAVANDCVVGYIGGRVVFDEAELYRVAVLPEFRGRGFGEKLVQIFVDRCGELGAKNIFLEVREDNAVAQKIYASVGFKKIGQRKNYYGNGMDAVLMSRKL